MHKEESGRKQWNETHGWLADYDPKVNHYSIYRVQATRFQFSRVILNLQNLHWKIQHVFQIRSGEKKLI